MDVLRIDPQQHYALAVALDGLVLTAGIVADDLSADLRGQARQVFAEIDRLLEKAGSHKSRLISASVWLRDISDFEAINDVWDNWVDQSNLPVRATVEARLADPSILIEVQVTATRLAGVPPCVDAPADASGF